MAVLIGVQIAMFVFSLWWLSREDRRGPGGDGPGGGGPGKRPPDGPLPSDGPAWWPEFERELAGYAAERKRRDKIGA